MANLQCKEKNIKYSQYNFNEFTSKKRVYNFPSILKSLYETFPNLKPDIKAFKENLENFCKKYKTIPTTLVASDEVVTSGEITKNIQSFMDFKQEIFDLEKQLLGFQEKLKPYYDPSKFSETYKENIEYYSTYGTGGSLKILKTVGKKRVDNGYLKLNPSQYEIVKYSNEISVPQLIKLGILNSHDLIDLAFKNPFSKLLKTELYQSSESDFSFREESSIALLDTKVYYIGVELENVTPSFHWLAVRGAGNAVYVDYYTDMNLATPLNSTRLKEVLDNYMFRDKCVVCEYGAQIVTTCIKNNQLTNKVQSLIEKDKINSGLVDDLQVVKKKALKI